MNRLVMGVVVAMVLAVGVVWTSGCGQQSPTGKTVTKAAAVPQTAADKAKLTQGQQAAKAMKMSDQSLAQLMKSTPKSDWSHLPPAIRQQLEAYAKAHGGS